MGYGSRTLQLLCDYYLGKLPNLSETMDSEDLTETRVINDINVLHYCVERLHSLTV